MAAPITCIQIDKNVANGPADGQPILVLTPSATFAGRMCHIAGPSVIVFRPDKPLPPRNARVWIETTAPVHLDGRRVA